MDIFFSIFYFLIYSTNFYSSDISQFIFSHLHPILMQIYAFSGRIRYDCLSQIFLMTQLYIVLVYNGIVQSRINTHMA